MYLDLAHRLGMGLNELMGWPGAMTHRQFMAWWTWLLRQDEEARRASTGTAWAVGAPPPSFPGTYRRTPVSNAPTSEEELKRATAVKKAWVLGGLGMRFPKDYKGEGPVRLERIPDIKRK